MDVILWPCINVISSSSSSVSVVVYSALLITAYIERERSDLVMNAALKEAKVFAQYRELHSYSHQN